ncbi:MAG: DUF4392 domain-containing protein [Lachnospiraceae bacterium]|nr:DUF4392 domain-containing protein [Lachnospiraceae bacterium]MBQ5485743.1 DUF4392 domain-containing protein [Lachnospiraceae bacterium]
MDAVREEETIEDIVLRHSTRGMTLLRKHLPKDFCHRAAEEILRWDKGTILLTTGFYVAGFAETDGPVGTVMLAKALQKLGYTPVIVTDSYCEGFFDHLGMDVIYMSLQEKTEAIDGLLEELKPVGMISIERCGKNANGTYANMRGVDISPYTAPCDELFKKARYKIPTIGVGDGGNEIGMGNIPEEAAKMLDIDFCKIKTTVLVIASVSNWGAYGIIAALEEITRIPIFPEKGKTVQYIHKIVELGSVDGVSHKHTPSVDGFDLTVEQEITNSLRSKGA